MPQTEWWIMISDYDCDRRRDRTINEDLNIWTTQGGQQIPIAELPDDHLGNILRFLQRKAVAERRVNFSKILWHLLPEGPGVYKVSHRKTSEGFLVRSECPYVRPVSFRWRAYAHPKFPALEAEAINRGLDWNLIPDEMWDEQRDLLLLHALAKGTLEKTRGDEHAIRN